MATQPNELVGRGEAPPSGAGTVPMNEWELLREIRVRFPVPASCACTIGLRGQERPRRPRFPAGRQALGRMHPLLVREVLGHTRSRVRGQLVLGEHGPGRPLWNGVTTTNQGWWRISESGIGMPLLDRSDARGNTARLRPLASSCQNARHPPTGSCFPQIAPRKQCRLLPRERLHKGISEWAHAF